MENQELQDEVHYNTTENQKLQKSIADHKQQLTQYEHEVDSKTTENDGLKRALSAQKQQMERLKGELESKTRENKELSELTEIQNERLRECQREVEQSQMELRRMENLADKLQQKGVGNGNQGKLKGKSAGVAICPSRMAGELFVPPNYSSLSL